MISSDITPPLSTFANYITISDKNETKNSTGFFAKSSAHNIRLNRESFVHRVEIISELQLELKNSNPDSFIPDEALEICN